MKRCRWRMILALAACAVYWHGQRDAAAQSLGSATTDLGAAGMAASLLPSSGSPMGLSGAGTTTSVLPSPVPLFSPSVPSVTSDPTATVTGSGSTATGMMSSPFAAPFLYSSMMQATMPYSASTSSTSSSASSTATRSMGMGMMNPAQLGLLMMATQNTGGVGSGQMSRTAPRSPSSSLATNAQTAAKARHQIANRPGGLAARYYNRAGTRTGYPQSYFNRQSRYFP